MLGVDVNGFFKIGRENPSGVSDIFIIDPNGDASFNNQLIVEGKLFANNNSILGGMVQITNLNGNGNAYACLTADGTLYRSQTPCN